MDDIGLTYLLAHPASLGFGFARPLALTLVAAAWIFVRRPSAKQQSPRTMWTRATMLRVSTYTLIVLGMAGARLTASLPNNELTLVALVDVSGSIRESGLEWSDRYLRNLSGGLAPGDSLAIVRFAEAPELISTAGRNTEWREIQRPADVAVTDLGTAIDHAVTLYPHEAQKALLVISDGNETSGDSRARIETLRGLGIRVHAVSPPNEAAADTRITKLVAPGLATLGRPLPVRVVIRNGGAVRPAVLNLYLDGLMSDSTAVSLHAGINAFDLLLSSPERGAHVIRAEIATEGDETLQNNIREVTVNIRQRTRVTLATPRKYSALGEVLTTRGFSVRTIAPNKLGTDDDDFADDDLIVLEDIRGTQLKPTSLKALGSFVRIGGGGLIVAGGGATFGDKSLQGTELDKMLPVTLEARRPRPGKREPMALFIVIDRSNSMGFNSRIGTLRDGEKLRYAIQAGMAGVKQLLAHDRVGVIAFDARPHEIAPLRPLKENRRKLLDALPRIVESGGTDFYDALAIAADQLRRARVSRKHVVLLTDGDTNRAAGDEYRDLIAKLAAAKISVTTIRIGDNTVNLKLLQQISNGTGGSFHHVADAQMLPDLMLRDTSRALRPLAPNNQLFFPAVGSRHQLFEQSDEVELPHLRDYAFSKSKQQSETLLHIDRSNRQDPLLSVWRYGLGRVAAFTASPRDDAESWPGWEGYARFWSDLAYWTARRESDHDVSVRAVRRGGSTEIIAERFGRNDSGAIISGRLFVDENFTIDADFVADQEGLYHAELRELPPGRFPMELLTRSSTGTVHETRTIVAIPAQREDEMAEYRHTGNNDDLLRELTSRTDGTLNAPAADILNRPAGNRTVSYPLAKFLIPLAMLGFFIDVALRRIASLGSTR